MRQRVYGRDGMGRKGGRRNQRRLRKRQETRNRSRASAGDVTARIVSPRIRAPHPCFRAVEGTADGLFTAEGTADELFTTEGTEVELLTTEGTEDTENV